MSACGWLGPLVVLVSLSSFSSEAAAQKAEADAAFQRGRELMDKGETAAACVEFEASMRFEAQHGTLYNLALCHEELGKLATAYSELKELASIDTNKARAKDAAKRMKAIEPKLTKMHLVVGSQVEGLRVERDGLDVTVFVGREVAVDPAEYTFVATAPGREPARVTIALDKAGVVEVAIPELAVSRGGGGPDPVPKPTPLANDGDAYSLSLVHRPLALPKNVVEATALSQYYTSQDFMTDPIDVGVAGRIGLGSLEASVATAFHARYPVDDERADAWAFLRLGGGYIITPKFTGTADYTLFQPTGGPVSGSDFGARLARKYDLASKVAIEGRGGVVFSQRQYRGGGEAQEFALAGRGAIQLAAASRLTFEASMDAHVNLGGELYRHTLGLTLTGLLLVGIDRHTDAFAAASFEVAPSDSDLKIYWLGVTRRIP